MIAYPPFDTVLHPPREIILQRINELNCDVFCYLHDGPLKSLLLERYLDEPDSLSDMMEFDFDASLQIKKTSETSTDEIILRLEFNDFLYQTALNAATLTVDQYDELRMIIQLHCPDQATRSCAPSKNIVRKKHGNNLLNIAQAAQAIGVSQRKIKEIIPCSEMRIVDNGPTKSIEGYYWDQRLIQRLSLLNKQQQQGIRYTNDDINFIAENCCEGDIKWAQDTIATYLKHCQ